MAWLCLIFLVLFSVVGCGGSADYIETTEEMALVYNSDITTQPNLAPISDSRTRYCWLVLKGARHQWSRTWPEGWTVDACRFWLGTPATVAMLEFDDGQVGYMSVEWHP